MPYMKPNRLLFFRNFEVLKHALGTKQFVTKEPKLRKFYCWLTCGQNKEKIKSQIRWEF